MLFEGLDELEGPQQSATIYERCFRQQNYKSQSINTSLDTDTDNEYNCDLLSHINNDNTRLNMSYYDSLHLKNDKLYNNNNNNININNINSNEINYNTTFIPDIEEIDEKNCEINEINEINEIYEKNCEINEIEQELLCDDNNPCKKQKISNACEKTIAYKPKPIIRTHIYKLDKTGLIQKGHKIARGRARSIQLQAMTKEEQSAEKTATLEKNRLAALSCRKRKKEYYQYIQSKLLMSTNRDKEQQATIKQLNIEIQLLKTKT
jgi:hypothetical protein